MSVLLLVALLAQEKTAEQLIENLRSESVEDRESAARDLKKMGEAARPALEKAAGDKDREVATRAQAILDPMDLEAGQAVLNKLEETVLKAKTVKVRFKYEGRGPKGGVGPETGSGTLLLKEGGRVRFEIAFSSLEEKHRVTIVSDGTQLAASIDFAKPITKEAPKELHSLFSKGLVRGGLVLMGNRQSTSDPNEFIKTQAARSGDGGDEGKTLIYSALLPQTGETADIKLWYNPKSFEARDRKIVLRKDGQITASLTETYEEFTLNADIPDEKFKLPEK